MVVPLIFLMFCSLNLDYAQIFGADYQKALSFCVDNKTLIDKKATLYQLPADELMAIVFPELIRRSAFQDFFETKALSVAYVNQGSELADFSIGVFQMKPSFVEALEAAINTNSYLKKSFNRLINYPRTTVREKRVIRLKRLQVKAWQLEYLCCFYALIKHKFKNELSALTNKDRIQFFATAYNAGFSQSFSSIQKWTTRACYPYGIKYPANQQYIYANIAWDYYQKKINKSVHPYLIPKD